MIIITDKEIIQILQDHSDVYESNNFFAYPFRWLGWKIIQGLNALVSGIEGAVTDIFHNLNFFEVFYDPNTETKQFMKTIQPIIFALLLIGIVIIGYQIMFNRQKEKSQILINVILFFGIIGGIGSFASSISEITSLSTNAFMPSTSYSSTGDETIRTGITDLLYIDKHDPTDHNTYGAGSNPSANALDFIDPNALMKPDECTNTKLFENRIEIDDSGNAVLKALGDGKGLFGIGSDAFSEYYYRYSIDWSTIIVSLLVLTFSLLLTAIKMAKIIFEIAYNIIFILFVAPLDLYSGQRTKKCIQEILSLFLVLIAIALMYRVYFYGMTWTSSTFDTNGFAKLLVQIGMSWALIDGPNIVQKILGIDAGLSSAFTALANAYHGSQIVKSVASAGAKVAKTAAAVAGKAAGLATKGGAFAAGHAAGMYDNHKSSKKDGDSDNKGGIWGDKQLQNAEKADSPSGSHANDKHEGNETPNSNPKSPDSGGGNPHDIESGSKDSNQMEQNAMQSNTEDSKHSQGADDTRSSAESLHTQDSGQDTSSEHPDINSVSDGDKGESVHSSDADNTSASNDKSQNVDNNHADSNGLYGQEANSVSSKDGQSNHQEVQSADKAGESLHPHSQGQSESRKQNSQAQNMDGSKGGLHSGNAQRNSNTQPAHRNADSKTISGKVPNSKQAQNAGANSNGQAISKNSASRTANHTAKSGTIPANSATRPIDGKSGSGNTPNPKSTQNSGMPSNGQGAKPANSNAQSIDSNASSGHTPNSKQTHDSTTTSNGQGARPTNSNAQSIGGKASSGRTPNPKSTHNPRTASSGQSTSSGYDSGMSGTAPSNSASQSSSGRSHAGNAAQSTAGNTQQTNQSSTASTIAATQAQMNEQITKLSNSIDNLNTQLSSGNQKMSVRSRLNSLTADVKGSYHNGYNAAVRNAQQKMQDRQNSNQATTKTENNVNPQQSQSHTPTPDITNAPKPAKPKFNPFRRNRKNKKGGKK